MLDTNGGGSGAAPGWLGIVANAGAGTGRGRNRVSRFVESANHRGIRAEVAWTIEERGELVARANTDPNCLGLLGAGGDGTIAALINECPRVPIGALPAGTENLFAQQFRYPKDPSRLALSLDLASTAPIDLGLAGDRRFSLMAGIGFDGDVVTRHHHERIRQPLNTRTTSRLAYVLPILHSAASYRFPRVTAEILDPGREEKLAGAMIFAFNLPKYALGLPVVPRASGDDGELDLIVFRRPGPLQMVRYLWMVMRGIHLSRKDVSLRRVRHARISSEAPVAMQLDGDPAGVVDPDHPLTISVLPRAVRVFIPRPIPHPEPASRPPETLSAAH